MYAYATRVSLLLPHPSVFQLLPPLLSYGYVCIIATNISHRPTFRSTTQHNHCRIITVFLDFFLFFFPLTRPMRFSHRLILQYQVLNHIIVCILYIYISNIYNIYNIYIILKLTRYILLTRHTQFITRKKLSLPLARTHSYPICLRSPVLLHSPHPYRFNLSNFATFFFLCFIFHLVTLLSYHLSQVITDTGLEKQQKKKKEEEEKESDEQELVGLS